MKVFGKKTVIIDCEWDLGDQPELQKKLESMNKKFDMIKVKNSNTLIYKLILNAN